MYQSILREDLDPFPGTFNPASCILYLVSCIFCGPWTDDCGLFHLRPIITRIPEPLETIEEALCQ